MITVDRRSDAQRETHTWYVVGTDQFLRDWGDVALGAAYAAWACTPDTVDTVYRWVRSRGEMLRVRVVRAKGYRPRCAHLSIYPVTPDHRYAQEGSHEET